MITASQVSVGTSAGKVLDVPPGPCTVVLSNTSATDVYVGGPNVTTSNGFGIPAGSPPVPVPGYPGSAGTSLFAIAGSATTLGVLLSKDN